MTVGILHNYTYTYLFIFHEYKHIYSYINKYILHKRILINMIFLLLASFTYICSYSSLKYICLDIKLKVIQELKYLNYFYIIITKISIYILYIQAKVSNLLLFSKDMRITRTCYLRIMV